MKDCNRVDCMWLQAEHVSLVAVCHQEAFLVIGSVGILNCAHAGDLHTNL